MRQIEFFSDIAQLSDWDHRKKCNRLFFAVMPDIATAKQIYDTVQAFHREHGLDRVLQFILREHVSILLVGDYKRRLRKKDIFAAELAARRISMPAFDITFNAIGSFAGAPAAMNRLPHRPLVLRADDAGPRELRSQLRRALGRKLLPASKAFIPHLTVSYGPEMVPFQPIAPIRFTAGELVLIHSEVGLTRYHVINRWPLTGGVADVTALRVA